jgi:hypothetical protein
MLHNEFQSPAIVIENRVSDNFCLALFFTSIWLEVPALIQSLDFSLFNSKSYDFSSEVATIYSIGDRV